MKEGYRNNLLLVAWVSVFFLHLHVVKSKVTYLKARADKQDIKSLYYPQNYPKYYSGEWLISAPEGYRIRLEFQDFNLGTCGRYGALLEVWTSDKMLELCGQKLPPTIESSGREMELFLSPSSQPDSQGGRFWARYKMFNKNEVRLTTSRPIQDLSTGDGETNSSNAASSARIQFSTIAIIILTVLLLAVPVMLACLYCCCRGRRSRPTVNQELLEIGITNLNYLPSYTDRPHEYQVDISLPAAYSDQRQTDDGTIAHDSPPSYDEVLDNDNSQNFESPPSYEAAMRESNENLESAHQETENVDDTERNNNILENVQTLNLESNTS